MILRKANESPSRYLRAYRDKFDTFEDLKENQKISDLEKFFEITFLRTSTFDVEVNLRFQAFSEILSGYIYKALDELEEAVEVE